MRQARVSPRWGIGAVNAKDGYKTVTPQVWDSFPQRGKVAQSAG